MYNLIKLPKEELNTVINNTAARKGMNTAIVEKDLWVCITLDYLFHHSKWKDQLAFKGGTCLSKVYHLIERFSEDIDLILDWRVLGYGSSEPWEERSNTKQLKFIEESRDRLFAFLKEDFLPEFRNGMSQLLNINCDVYIEDNDLGTVIFAYPHSFNDNSILSVIRLEIGALASWIPLNKVTVKPFVAEEYPNIVSSSDVELLATTPERTFWEKATILHQEAFRPEGSLIPDRYSRHYYDIYCMYKNGIKDNAINNPKLLEDVASFKMKFYPRGWARYDLARFGTLKLMPAQHSLDRLKKDYESMKSMIYGVYPSFDEILEVINQLEQETNVLDKKINRFIVMCVEQYASSVNKDSGGVYNKLNEAGIIDELKDDYEDMHGMSTYSLNEYINKRLGVDASDEKIENNIHTPSKIILISQTIELIAKKYKLTIEEARNRFYSSKVIETLDDDETGLYGESALYLLSLFESNSK